MRSDIQQMIADNRVCVLATVSGGSPHCSLMSYAASDDCREIYMATFKNTRKYQNLVSNPSVSLLIDTRDAAAKGAASHTRALTVTGVLDESVTPNRKKAIREALIKKHPDLEAFFSDPDTRIVVVRIQSLQLLDGVTDAYFETPA